MTKENVVLLLVDELGQNSENKTHWSNIFLQMLDESKNLSKVFQKLTYFERRVN